MAIYDPKTGKTNRARYSKGTASFSDIGQNLHIIARRLLTNENLLKLLVHTDKNALSTPLTDEQREKAFGDQIRIIPVINKDEHIKNYIIIQFGGFSPAGKETSDMYKQYFLSFDVVCNIDNWMLNDYTPRPYKIMAEIDKEIGESKMQSLGPVEFVTADNLVINEELSGFTLVYRITSEM